MPLPKVITVLYVHAGEAQRTGYVVEITAEHTEGTMPRPERNIVVRVLMPDGSEKTASGIDGETIRVNLN